MSAVWICVPSKRPVEHVVEWAACWRAMGYKIALWRDEVFPGWGSVCDELLDGVGTYPGYANAVNSLTAMVLETDPECNWIVTGGDDVYPDPDHTADEIERQCVEHFGEYIGGFTQPFGNAEGTFGVMQPIGDTWGEHPNCMAAGQCVCQCNQLEGAEMSVWLCVPSKRPVEHVVQWAAAWRERGYKIALWRDSGDGLSLIDAVDHVRFHPYPGYAVAVNYLALEIIGRGGIAHDPDCNWIVTGGDDVYPDPNHRADEIALQCAQHFYKIALETATDQECRADAWRSPGARNLTAFGVMQPTGDTWGERPNLPEDHPLRGPYITRVCGSPWMGREFCERINQGRGPLWPAYQHMFCDEELQNVALKYGVLWQRPDLTHRHEHWARARADRADMPAFLTEVSGPKHWAEAKALFESRKAAGFPGSEPL